MSLERRWLPDCATCAHPYSEHIVGTLQPPTEPDCAACPSPCSYVYTHPVCWLCAEQVIEDYWMREGHVWHRVCWRGDPYPVAERTPHGTSEPPPVQPRMAPRAHAPMAGR